MGRERAAIVQCGMNGEPTPFTRRDAAAKGEAFAGEGENGAGRRAVAYRAARSLSDRTDGGKRPTKGRTKGRQKEDKRRTNGRRTMPRRALASPAACDAACRFDGKAQRLGGRRWACRSVLSRKRASVAHRAGAGDERGRRASARSNPRRCRRAAARLAHSARWDAASRAPPVFRLLSACLALSLFESAPF